MASYIDAALGGSERVAFQAKLHWMMFVWPIVWTVVSFGFLIFITLPWLIVAALTAATTELAVTEKRLIAKQGIVSRRVVELRLAKVESVRVDQGLFGRIFDYGTITISGTGTTTTTLRNIDQPLAFKRAAEIEIERIEEAQQHQSARATVPA